MGRLDNKKAIITGGSSGIGLATAIAYIKEGAEVIITGRNKNTIDKALKQIDSDKAIGVVCDVSKVTDLDQLYTKVANDWGKFDILFANAGIAAFAPAEYLSEQQVDDTLDINVKGVFFSIQKAAPLLNEGASIIVNGSINATVAMANSTIYAASKAAALALTRVFAIELAPKGIRVNSISPGPVSTPIYGKLGFPEADLNAFASAMQNSLPLKRFGNPDEIANMAVFLACKVSAYVTGSDFVMDGGAQLNKVL
jgi:NAD(P)-dependent dehydrogenase (short-subunit alcohol dehydrogenase family)